MFNESGNRNIIDEFWKNAQSANLPQTMKEAIARELQARVLGVKRPSGTIQFLTNLLADALLEAISKPPSEIKKPSP